MPASMRPMPLTIPQGRPWTRSATPGTGGLLLFLIPVFVLSGGCTRTEVVVTGTDGGECTDAGCLCSPGTEECDDRCVDLQTDPEHCGQCDRSCGALEECREGACECLAGTDRCGGSLCLDLERDPFHCGTCEETCEGAEACLGGECLCRPGLTRCSVGCVDTSFSAEHCGTCEHACSSDPAGDYCFDGACTMVACEERSPSAEGCGPLEQDCVPPAELASNPIHCGECDEVCDAAEVCTQGECRAFFAPVDCTACPCPYCGSNLCCAYPGTTLPVCVVGASVCPTAP